MGAVSGKYVNRLKKKPLLSSWHSKREVARRRKGDPKKDHQRDFERGRFGRWKKIPTH